MCLHTALSPLWIPRSKIIWSNWELISQFRCLLTSWIPRFDFFKGIWEVRSCKCFKIHEQHSLWFLKAYKNCFSGNCFSLCCKYLVKQFPACYFILKNGNSWMKEQLVSSKKSKSRPFFSWSGNSWFPEHPNIFYRTNYTEKLKPFNLPGIAGGLLILLPIARRILR